MACADCFLIVFGFWLCLTADPAAAERRVALVVGVKLASLDALDAVRAKPDRVCPLVCDAGRWCPARQRALLLRIGSRRGTQIKRGIARAAVREDCIPGTGRSI
jgi:hypothetical protein